MAQARDDVLDILYTQLKELAVDERVVLEPALAASTTLGSLQLTSLDTLQLALGLEDALNIEIEVLDLPKDRTILEIADDLLRRKQ